MTGQQDDINEAVADATSQQRSQAAWICCFMTVALKMYLQTMNFQASFVIYVHILLLSSSKELLIVQQLHISDSLFHLHIMLTVTTILSLPADGTF